MKIKVDGFPPKKHGEKSMWDNKTEVRRLIKLRNEIRKKLENRKPLSKNIYLKLIVNIPKNNKIVGDLDNFLTGVCDGLMKANPRSKISEEFNKHPSIDPREIYFIEDDSQIVKIIATKMIKPGIKPYYKLEISEEMFNGQSN
jgi:Holliday junction resolvase RusA-like endonuclease